MAVATNTQSGTAADETPRRRRGGGRRTSGTGGRGRRPRLSAEDVVASLSAMVDQLIEENRQLKRALARAEQAGGSAGLGQATKTLSGLQRRVSRALAGSTTSRRRRTTEVSVSARPRRKVTDPDELQRRRDALAKARAALAAKRRAESGS